MTPFSKHLPDFVVWETCSETRAFEFKEVVLVGVQIDGVDTLDRALAQVVEDVVARGCDGDQNVVGLQFEDFEVDSRVFPVESVDVLRCELGMFGKKIRIGCAPGVMLVERCGKWQI